MSIRNGTASIGASRHGIWVVPLLVIGFGMLIARFVTTVPGYFLIAGSIAILLGLILVRHLQFALIGYMFLAALAFGESPAVQSPNSGYKAGLMPSELLLAFLLMLWIGRAIFVDGFKPVKSHLNRPLVALGLVSVVSLVFSNTLIGLKKLPFHQLAITQFAEIGLLCLSICAYFFTANALKDGKWIGRIFAPVILLAVYFSGHRIIGYDLPIPMIWGSLILAMGIAFIYSRLLFGKLSRPQKIWFGFLLPILAYAAYSDAAWISGWVAVTGVILIVTWFRSKGLAVLLLALMLFALFVYPGVYHSIHEESELGGDFDRFVIWVDASRMFMNVNPILGVGPGNYQPYVLLHNTIWFGSQTYTTAHSNYVQMAAELGLMGLAVFFWVIVGGIMTGLTAVRRAPPELRWLAIAATAIFASMAVTSMFGDYMFPSRGNNGLVNFGTTVYLWLIMGAAAAAANLRQPAEDG